MKILDIKNKLVANLELQKGIDFKDEDLTSFYTPMLKELKTDSALKIAISNGFDGWSWSGHMDENGKIRITVYKIL